MPNPVRAAKIAKRQKVEAKAKYAYTPHPGQEAAHRSTARIRACFTGNDWGKTTCGVKEMDWWMGGDHQYRTDIPKGPIRGRCIADGFDVGVDKILLPLFRKHVNPNRLKGGSWETAYSAGRHELEWKTGNVLEFMSYAQKDQGRGAQKFEGARLAIFWPDEHCPPEIIDACRARVGRTPVHEFYTYTPLLGLTWEYYNLHLKYQAGDAEDLECFYGEGLDNPHVSSEGLKAMYAGISDPRLRAARKSGSWFALGGAVYGMWRWDVHFIPYDQSIVDRLTKSMWIDPHPQKPDALLWCGIDIDNQRYAYRELLSSQRIPQTVDTVRELSLGETIWRMGIDASQTGQHKHNQDGKSIRQMYEEALGCGLHLGRNEEQPKIESVRRLLDLPPVGPPALFVMDSCPVLAEQIERNQFKPQTDAAKAGDHWARIKEHDDLLSCLEYYGMSEDTYQGQRPAVSVVATSATSNWDDRYGDRRRGRSVRGAGEFEF
jgi:hypothetical protein